MINAELPSGVPVVVKEDLHWRCWTSVGLNREDYEGTTMYIGHYNAEEELRLPDGGYGWCDTYYMKSAAGYEDCWMPTWMFEVQNPCMFPKEVSEYDSVH
jgi:hypothetical protein